MPDQDPIVLERDGDVAIISLNRPEKLNAIHAGAIEDFKRLEDEVRADKTLHAIVLTGKGRAFCAGADLSRGPDWEYGEHEQEQFPIRADGGWPIGWFGMNIPLPVVAAVNGAAVGYGAELIATCDMRIAGESARIGWVFAKRGMVTDMGVGPVLLPRLVGIPNAARLLFSGEIVDAQEALRIGLVQEVVPDSDLLARAVAVARNLGSGAPNSIAVHKRQIYESLRRDPHDIYFANIDEFDRTKNSEDFREGINSFLEKRPPVWTGR